MTVRLMPELPPVLAENVKKLLIDNKKLEAIKIVRERTGWSLVNAKNSVEDYQYTRTELPAINEYPDIAFINGFSNFRLMPPLKKELEEEIKRIIEEGPEKKIFAIKIIREETGYGLKEAKDTYEDYQYKRIDLPKISWLEWKELKNAERKTAIEFIMQKFGLDCFVSGYLLKMIIEGKYPEPLKPKYRNLDDLWD